MVEVWLKYGRNHCADADGYAGLSSVDNIPSSENVFVNNSDGV
jgi:predicted TIM-barrel enzyme